MKKLITLLLVLCGGISQASAAKKTIYVEDTYNKKVLYLYAYSGDNNNQEWRGVEQTKYSLIDGKRIYEVELDDTYSSFILNADDYQTADFGFNEVTEGTYYYISYDGSANRLYPMTLYTYNFTTTTAEDYGSLKIHLFKDSAPINGEWEANPSMTQNLNVYTYSYKTFQNGGSDIGVIFHNETYGQTDDLGASVGDNTYVLKYDENETNKLREAEKVTTNSNGYCTYVNTRALTIPTSTAYYAKDNANGSATAYAITNPPANTPMLIKGDPSTTYYFAVASSGTALENTNAFQAGDGNAVAKNVGGKYNYLLNGATFKAANGTNKVAVGKAYLQLSQEATGASRILIFDDDNETTGIRLVDYEQQTGDDCYNLQGIKVASPTKGVYLRNGKKFIVK